MQLRFMKRTVLSLAVRRTMFFIKEKVNAPIHLAESFANADILSARSR